MRKCSSMKMCEVSGSFGHCRNVSSCDLQVVGHDEVGDALSLTDELGNLKMAVLSLRERQDNSLSASSASTVLLRQLLSAVAVVSEACNTMATGTRYAQAQNISEFPTISNGKNGPQGSGNQLALLQDRPGSRQLSESTGRQLVVARPDTRDEFLPELSWEALVSQSLQNVPRDEENLMHAVLQASGDCRNFLKTLGKNAALVIADTYSCGILEAAACPLYVAKQVCHL